ncbi:GNAT family N-acetyltransferase [Streptomyces sp. NBC_01381]|uniref:GNAT family N-acetyltransferase n=1 Tax=Streptomyces sp. NBC_01381 TaxID=2903845 RepID=UPI00225599B8|nr:GNAT family N-acetyltransferase [Streptomyces sp. NBC_01381]MCX4671173.1 GNAT family N-acetyltransferase [Streptomyces sp. NBC_01381]
MIEISPAQLPSLSDWFPPGIPGATTLAEHASATGNGRWWADRATRPRVVAVSCADQVLLAGDPRALAPGDLAGFASHHAQATRRFLPMLGHAFDQVVPRERMVYVHRYPGTAPRLPRGVTVRRLLPDDVTQIHALSPDAGWLHATWGGPAGLAASGQARGAFHKGHLLAVACTYLRGDRYEDIAIFTTPEHRRRGLARACVAALCIDITTRGRTPSWSCSRENRASRLLAWTSGFRLEREYVHYLTGQPAHRTTRIPA